MVIVCFFYSLKVKLRKCVVFLSGRSALQVATGPRESGLRYSSALCGFREASTCGTSFDLVETVWSED